MQFLLPLLLPLLLLAAPAAAVLIDSGAGTGNTTAPASDPGWDNVGTRGNLSVVYLGNSYVITASHTGVGDVVFNGITHQAVPGTDVVLRNPDMSFADLRLFSIHPIPLLPSLTISSVVPGIGDDIVLIGNGRDRGDVTSWDSNGPPPPGPIGGYEWLGSQTMRWGTNEVDSYSTISLLGLTTKAIVAIFDAGALPHESIATTGDSGGALFHDTGSQWELGGIMFVISQFGGQPANASLYGNAVHSVDLAFYQDDILAVVALPESASGLWWGTAALLALARRRRR